MVDMSAWVFRDFVTDGVPASGANKPLKSKIRAWGAFLEGRQVGTSLLYTFSSATADADPGDGVFRLNNATPSSVTAAYIDNVDATGATASGILDGWDDSTNVVKGALTIRGVDDPTVVRVYNVTGTVIDGTGYRKLTLVYVGGSGIPAGGNSFLLTFSRSGDSNVPAGTTAGYLLQTNGVGSNPTWAGFTQTGTGAVATTHDAKLRSTALCVFDFMTAAQVADVQSRAFTLDVSTPVANWFAACLAQKKAGYAPAGRYRIDSQFLMDCASVPTTGFTIFGDGIQNTLFDATNVATIPAFKLFCSGGTTGSPISQNYAKILGIGFAANQNGQMFQVGLTNKADQINLARLEIWLANYSAGSSATLLEANNCYGCHFEFNGNTASTPRTILTLGAITAGSGYVNGTYSNVPLTGGNGGFATANITVAGGVVTAVTLVSGGFGYNATESLSALNTNLGGSGSGFSVLVSTVRITTSCGVRLIQCAFSYFFISIGGVNRAVHITSGFSYGNVFISPDLEIVDYCVVIDSANAQNNTFIGGQWAYYAFGVSATAGEDNVFINNNINSPYPLLSPPAGNVGIYEFDSRAMTVRGLATLKGGASLGAAAIPTTNDGAALGSAANQWSDLFLASGGVINAANGNYTVTHSTGNLSFSGSADFTGAVLPTVSGTPSLGSTIKMWNSLFLASGGVVNFNNGNYTVTHTSGVLTFSGAVLTSGTGGIGYATGAGGAVTQLTSRTTGVTLNKPSGAITLFSAAGTGTVQKFTVTNSTVEATDTISFNQKSGSNDYITHVTAVAAGSFTVMFWTSGVATDSPVFNFNLIKGKNA